MVPIKCDYLLSIDNAENIDQFCNTTEERNSSKTYQTHSIEIARRPFKERITASSIVEHQSPIFYHVDRPLFGPNLFVPIQIMSTTSTHCLVSLSWLDKHSMGRSKLLFGGKFEGLIFDFWFLIFDFWFLSIYIVTCVPYRTCVVSTVRVLRLSLHGSFRAFTLMHDHILCCLMCCTMCCILKGPEKFRHTTSPQLCLLSPVSR